jgi:predicted ester cyclase
MSTRRSVLIRSLGVCAAAALLVGHSLPVAAAAEASSVAANKAVVQRYLEALGTSKFADVSKQTQSSDYKLLRHEFENLKFNADDPKLSKAMQPDAVAIADRSNTITRILGQGDTVAATIRIKGTHKGNLYGIPATGKPIEIEEAAVFKLKNGKITEGWMMAEEAKLLRQLSARLPARQDGKLNPPPVYNDTRSFDDALQEMIAKPLDTPEYRHVKLLLAYKAKNKPADLADTLKAFNGRPYANLLRGGADNILERGKELNVQGSHGQSMSGRQDMLGTAISEGNQGMFQFRLTAKNTGPLYGIPASGHDLHDWEIGFAEFDGDKWDKAWYMGDELGFLLTIGNKEALDYLVGPATAP